MPCSSGRVLGQSLSWASADDIVNNSNINDVSPGSNLFISNSFTSTPKISNTTKGEIWIFTDSLYSCLSEYNVNTRHFIANHPVADAVSLNLRGGYSLNKIFDINLGVENLFDKACQDHLGAYNRVAGSDVPLRERLYSRGRNYYIRLNVSW
jgi:outer membrane receptor protein involved in Fe transport